MDISHLFTWSSIERFISESERERRVLYLWWQFDPTLSCSFHILVTWQSRHAISVTRHAVDWYRPVPAELVRRTSLTVVEQDRVHFHNASMPPNKHLVRRSHGHRRSSMRKLRVPLSLIAKATAMDWWEEVVQHFCDWIGSFCQKKYWWSSRKNSFSIYMFVDECRDLECESMNHQNNRRRPRRKKHRNNSSIHSHSIRSVRSSHSLSHSLHASSSTSSSPSTPLQPTKKGERKNERKKETSKMSKIADSYVEAAWANRLQRLARSQQRRREKKKRCSH